MKNILEIFEERGFIEQVTDRDLLWKLTKNPTVCYIGFDPTGSSLHVGSLVPIMALTHMQKAGHTPIALMGGGTTLVGDPSGKTEMRRMMSRKEIEKNAEGIKRQLSRFIDFSPGKALMLNNADWLVDLSYIDFLRDIGRHFSVNRMLTAESYKVRMKTGLSFIEFNYMLLQAYDFHVLHRDYQCTIQMGGQDQWGNIVAGVDLIRRVQSQEAFGITFPLLTTASGEKFGKTAAGAVWLDEQRTSVYDFYQFWRNSEDGELGRLLRLFTFLPLDEISRLEQLRDQGINRAKEILAFEVTTLVHGQEKAAEAYRTATGQFGAADPDRQIETSSAITTIETTTLGDNLPETIISPAELEQGITIVDLFIKTGLCSSKGQARRLIQQGGGYCNDNRITEDFTIDNEQLIDSQLILRAGKKRHHRIVIQT